MRLWKKQKLTRTLAAMFPEASCCSRRLEDANRPSEDEAVAKETNAEMAAQVIHVVARKHV